MNARFKQFALNNPQIFKPMLVVYNLLLGKNKFKIRKENNLVIESAQCKKTKVVVAGTRNKVFIGNLCRLSNCTITIYGNDNLVFISNNAYLDQAEMHIEDNNNEIRIGSHTTVHGRTHLAAIESTKIIIGEDCMFSSDIHFRTGDSHTIVDLSGKRINPSKDIIIGNHVWVGTKVICLKGTAVPDNCVIGAGSLLNAQYAEKNCIIAGAPAKMVKSNVNWLRDRISD